MKTKFATQTKRYTGKIRTGVESFRFDLPAGQFYAESKVIINSVPAGGGANIIEQPSIGVTGTITVKVLWWLAAIRPFPPRIFNNDTLTITVEIWTTNVPFRGKAILVCIENTGEVTGVPFPLSSDTATVLRRVVDAVTETSEQIHANHLFSGRYDNVTILCDTDCTKANIQSHIAMLGNQFDLDMAIIGHGGADGAGNAQLALHPNPDRNLATLFESDVRGWRTLPDMQNVHLGLVYMMNCKASKFSDAWIDLGFKTSVGSDGDDWMPEPMYTQFWKHYLAGDSAAQAAGSAWNESKTAWQAIPGYTPTVTVNPGVPGHVVIDDPGSPGRGHIGGVPPHWIWDESPRAPKSHWDPGTPSSTTINDNRRIVESKLIVAGDANRHF